MKTRTRRRKGAAPGYDPAYKRLFSKPLIVEELLRGFLHGDWTERLDFSTLERVPSGFVSEKLRERHSDVIWRLRLAGEDRWVYLYLLLEFQSASDPFMAVRLLTYVGLLLEDIIEREKLKPGDRLPVVLPLVLHNGKRPWRAPVSLESLFAPVPGELQRFLPRLTYCLLDQRRLDLDRPELVHNRTAALFRIETSATPADLPVLAQSLYELLPPGQPGLRRAVRSWMGAVVRRTFPEAIIPEGVNLEEAPMLEEMLLEWRHKFEKEARLQGIREARKAAREERRQARLEGRQEGRLEGQRAVLLRQMALRFGRLPKEVRSQVAQITSGQELTRLTRKILVAQSLQDLELGKP